MKKLSDLERKMQLAYVKSFGSNKLVLPNVYYNQTLEADILAISKSGFVTEVEIKTSKEDYLRDLNKTFTYGGAPRLKHVGLRSGLLLPNKFYYYFTNSLFESKVITNEIVVPPQYGVLIYDEAADRALSVLPPTMLHQDKIHTEVKEYLLKKMVYRYWRLQGVEGPSEIYSFLPSNTY